MNTEYKEVIRVFREFVSKRRIELILITTAAMIGAAVSYHLWRIDFW